MRKLGARRAFVLLFLAAMISLIAGSATPAYAVSNPAGWAEPYGVYLYSYVDDNAPPVGGIVNNAEGNLYQGVSGWAQSGTVTASLGSAGTFVSSTATYSQLPPSYPGSGINLSCSAQPDSYSGDLSFLALYSGAAANVWDTFTFYGGSGLNGTATVIGNYTTTGDTDVTSGGMAQIEAYYDDPSLNNPIDSQTLSGDTTDGSFDPSVTFPLDSGAVNVLWFVSGYAAAYYDLNPETFTTDPPEFSLILPEGVGYTDASGLDYGGDFLGQTPVTAVPEPATLTLLGLGLAGMVAKVARRKNR